MIPPFFIKIKKLPEELFYKQAQVPTRKTSFRNAYICVFNYTSIVWEIHHRNSPLILMGLATACMSAWSNYLVCERSRTQESYLIKEGSSSIELFNFHYSSYEDVERCYFILNSLFCKGIF